MKVDCTIDGKTLSLSLNSDKPLSLIINENLGAGSGTNHCNGNLCGLCAVLVDGKPTLSCLVPAFELRGKEVQTFDGFRRTKAFKDLEKAYDAVGAYPCSDCYEARSIIFHSLIADDVTDRSEILKELSVIKCSCMDPDDQVAIVKQGMAIRSGKRVRRIQ